MKNTFGVEIIPRNEKERLEQLAFFSILDHLPNDYFNDLARIIGSAFDSPIALVSIVAEEHVYFRGNFGMEGIHKVDRGRSLCSLAILNPEPTVFTDPVHDPCLLKNPLVHGTFGLRFYAGAPLITSNGYSIGSVCIVDKRPREWSESDSIMLIKFAEIAMLQMNTYYIDRRKTSNEK